jgi:tripartite ATP-independent transporter DctP family solute receptor
MRKKLMSLVLTAAMVGAMSLTAFAGETEMEVAVPDASGDPAVTLVFAEVNPLDTIIGQFDAKFAEEVEALSGGSIKIDMQDSGVLGGEPDFLDNMTGGIGTIDMCRTSVSTLTGYGTPKAVLLSLPFAFLSHDHFWNFVDSDVAQECLDEVSETGLGIKGICYAEEGFRNMFFNKEVNGIDDLKNLKIRVNSDPTMTGLISSFGANPTVVSYNELYSSLQTGVVDGAENPLNNYQANSFNEVAPYVLLTGHQLGISELVITEQSWEKLTEAQQACIYAAAEIAQEYDKKIVEEAEETAKKELEEKGVTFVEIDDKTPYTDAVADMIADSTKGFEDQWAAIQACNE